MVEFGVFLPDGLRDGKGQVKQLRESRGWDGFGSKSKTSVGHVNTDLSIPHATRELGC